ncbi:diguanylate cyclase (GGDEF)-like protein [Lachnospiraceae bacterium PF1-21]|uniref:Diguanylate cyclase n=1 Tax=Ohessyouella blattaphilus TaxID=2949333 RepID=A0ABT1EPT5_9FIRM|nr:diguanylate cyclase [Ohessyouella blattaphilus]MCP1111287.1 diguanylate cyclase [Ohessyouella blattaphilus]MCR8564681.1 diguanylate cyclase [Ohessyouella blattaphilus]MDL2249728.1 diguanylate cyclase [Lachnospiraceae bacterium OttesenSCG-928-J05]
MKEVADLLFEYLKNLLYHPQSAHLDVDALPVEFKELGQGLLFLGDCVNEQRTFASALAHGNLSTPPPSRDNDLAAPLKSLQSSLRHITWQSQQVAKGDYGQQIDFMGEFAEAFNTMIHQLDERQQSLLNKIEKIEKQRVALALNNTFLQAIADEIPGWIIALDCQSKRLAYTNAAAKSSFAEDPLIASELPLLLGDYLSSQIDMSNTDSFQLSVDSRTGPIYLAVKCYPLTLEKQNVIAFSIEDISANREEMLRLENMAYLDELTQLHNRRFGMSLFYQWLDEKKDFCLCFIDLDNLKYVNDKYGHTEGDLYIIKAADDLKSLASSIPVMSVSRLGGDEFMLLLQNEKKEHINTLLEELRTNMINFPMPEGCDYQYSISYGVVEIDSSEQRNASELLAIADELMYEYKRAHKKARPTSRNH